MEEVLFASFNQDASSLQVGTKKGYKLYNLSQTDDLPKLHESDVPEVCLVERLFSSSLVTLVSLNSPRKLRVCHFQKGTEICNHSYSNTILAVRLNRLRLVVCLEESLYIHNIRDMKVLHTIRDTPANPLGLCELSSADVSYLAYPGSSTIGEVQVFDASSLQAVTMIPAHDNPLAALKFNSEGSKIATASDKGTVIRVFSVPAGEKLFEFRRGMRRYVNISSLAFSPDSLFLASSSNTETIHVFKLEATKEQQKEEAAPASAASGLMDYVTKTAATYLPSQVSGILQQDRSFATAKLPHFGPKSAVALTTVKNGQRLLVATLEGYLYVYNVEKTEGGECTLVKQHRLIGEGGAKEGAEGTSYASIASPEKQRLQRAVDSVPPADEVENLHLDDSKEFPPMTHTSG